jgi:hypothetical protein
MEKLSFGMEESGDPVPQSKSIAGSTHSKSEITYIKIKMDYIKADLYFQR